MVNTLPKPEKEVGGYLVGEKDGKTIIHNDANLGGFLVGKGHDDGGIKAKNTSTGEELEFESKEATVSPKAVNDPEKKEFEGQRLTNREILSQINSEAGGRSFKSGGQVQDKREGGAIKARGNTVIITRPAVADNTKREFEGKMLTNLEIISKINEDATGVAIKKMEDGGKVGDSGKEEIKFLPCSCVGKKYNYGGKMCSDHHIIRQIGPIRYDVTEFKKGGISDETALIPEIIAEGAIADVIDEDATLDSLTPAEAYQLQEKIKPYLLERADRLFKNNDDFQKNIRARGDKGRDYLWSRMMYWTKNWIAAHKQEVRSLHVEYVPESPYAMKRGGAIGELDALSRMNKKELSNLYEQKFGRRPREGQFYEVILASVYYGKKPADLSDQEIEHVKHEAKFKNGGATVDLASVIKFPEFKRLKPDIKSPYVGEEDAVYKPKFNSYSGTVRYYKHGKRNLDSMSVQDAYAKSLYDTYGIDFDRLEEEDKKILFGELAKRYKFQDGGDVGKADHLLTEQEYINKYTTDNYSEELAKEDYKAIVEEANSDNIMVFDGVDYWWREHWENIWWKLDEKGNIIPDQQSDDRPNGEAITMYDYDINLGNVTSEEVQLILKGAGLVDYAAGGKTTYDSGLLQDLKYSLDSGWILHNDGLWEYISEEDRKMALDKYETDIVGLANSFDVTLSDVVTEDVSFAKGGGTRNDNEEEMRLRYAKKDIEQLESSSVMSIVQTKYGRLDLEIIEDIYMINDSNGTPLYAGGKDGAIEFVKEAYVVEYAKGGEVEKKASRKIKLKLSEKKDDYYTVTDAITNQVICTFEQKNLKDTVIDNLKFKRAFSDEKYFDKVILLIKGKISKTFFLNQESVTGTKKKLTVANKYCFIK